MSFKEYASKEYIQEYFNAAKAYTDSQRLAYTETKALTYDGNPDGKETCQMGNANTLAVRIGDIVDPYSITKLVGVMDGQTIELSANELTIQEGDNAIVVMGNGMQLVTIITKQTAVILPVGTYVSHANFGYVSQIEYETIHPIDPKYLPAGVGDNSVILDLNQLRLSFNTLFSGTEIPLGAEQIALADYAFKNKSDIVIVKDDSVGELYTDITKFRMTLNRVAYQDADGTNENVMEYSGMFFTSTGGGIVTLGLAYKTNLSSGVILGRALDITASTEV